jgi:hypothetical protein
MKLDEDTYGISTHIVYKVKGTLSPLVVHKHCVMVRSLRPLGLGSSEKFFIRWLKAHG